MSPKDRRKSIDSSDSDSNDSNSGHKDKKEKSKDKKDKKEKDKKDKDKKDKKTKDEKGDHSKKETEDLFHGGAPHSIPQMPLMPDMSASGHRVMPAIPSDVHNLSHGQAPPASGYRIPLHAQAEFPASHLVGTPPSQDVNGSPVFFGSALFDKSVHPCKVAPHLSPPCSVAFGGKELNHNGRFDLLPFDTCTMELVRASHGNLPIGRRLVEGGYEENGKPLFHGIGEIRGVRVPGKVAAHLGGINFSFGGKEHAVSDNYEVLCWK